MVEMWGALSADIRPAVLIHLSLSALCLLKRLDKETANACRRVIRSPAWQYKAKNNFDLQFSVSSSTQHLSFPLTVSLVYNMLGPAQRGGHGPSECSRGDKNVLLATIYKMGVFCGSVYPSSVPKRCSFHEAFSEETADDPTVPRLVDLSVEIHGHGVVSSELGLRRLIQDIVDERGHAKKRLVFPRVVSNKIFEGGETDEDGSIYEDANATEMDLKELLVNMTVLTEVSKDIFMGQDNLQSDEGILLSVFDMMALGIAPFDRVK